MVKRLGQPTSFNDGVFDKKTLAAIYEQFHEPIYRYVYRQVGSVEVARDLTADVFRRLLQAIQKGGGPDENVKAWLYRTAHNGVIDHYRGQAHRNHLSINEQVIAAEDDPARSAEHHLEAEQVREAIRQLTSDQQRLITLKFLAGLTNKEVSEVMNKPVGAVKSMQHRALATLRRNLSSIKEKA